MGRSRPTTNNTKYKKGFYELKNPKKYMGDPLDCFYDSSWERAFMLKCDYDEDILKWAAEPHEIPYMDHQGNWHRYYTDFYFEKKNLQDPEIIDKYYVEIKPHKEVHPSWIEYDEDGNRHANFPQTDNLKKLQQFEYEYRTYEKNLLKWSTAKEWCNRRYMNFKIVTEKDLKKWGVLNK